MRKLAYIIALIVLSVITLSAQKNNKNKSKLVCGAEALIGEAKKVKVSNVNGKIIIKGSDRKSLKVEAKGIDPSPEKAKGLNLISMSGKKANTDIGLSVTTVKGVVEVTGVSRKSSEGTFTFWVPKGVSVVVDYKSPFAYEDVFVEDFSDEIEISALNGSISMKNVTGPTVLNSTNGDINVDFTNVNQNSPISISAINGDLEIKLPSSTKSDISLESITGNLYTNFDIDFDKKNKKGLKYIGGNQKVKGKINGGGVKVNLKTITGNVYLRKK